MFRRDLTLLCADLRLCTFSVFQVGTSAAQHVVLTPANSPEHLFSIKPDLFFFIVDFEHKGLRKCTSSDTEACVCGVTHRGAVTLDNSQVVI